MAEIEVLGGGIFGLSVAFALQERGARVRLLEKRRIGAGASGGVMGALSPHVPGDWNEKKQFQFESLTASGAFWRRVDDLSGVSSGYGATGRLLPLADERALALARQRAEAARRHWAGAGHWEVVETSAFPDWAPASATGLLVHETLSARLHPIRALQSLSRAFQALGGDLVEGADGPRGADTEVWCTGHEGLADLSRDLGTEIGRGVKGQALLLAHDAATLPQIFDQGLYLVPHDDGSVAIGSTSETDWHQPDRTDDRLDALHRKAVELVPALGRAKVMRRWAGVRPRGRRRAPILGAHPARSGVFIANGGFKIGFGVAVRAGAAMADLILTGKADIPEAFSVSANLR